MSHRLPQKTFMSLTNPHFLTYFAIFGHAKLTLISKPVLKLKMPVEIGSLADWASALSNTVVLVFIYKQLRLMNVQMVQNDEQERFRRSWEYIKLYRDQLNALDEQVPKRLLDCEMAETEFSSEELALVMEFFYRPRLRLFSLLSQLLQHQEVEERLLFGYLIDEFNNFVSLGVKSQGATEFMATTGPRISMLLTAWGAQLKARKQLWNLGNTGKIETKETN